MAAPAYLLRGPLGLAVWRYDTEDLLILPSETEGLHALQVVRLNAKGDRYASTVLIDSQATCEAAIARVFVHVAHNPNGTIDLVDPPLSTL